MDNVVLLVWNINPKDYFEDEIRIIRENYEMTIKDGVVEARINPDIYDNEHKMRDTLHKTLNDRFLGVQLLTHKPYKLSKAVMYNIHSDGRKDVTVFPEACVLKITTGKLDIVVSDKDGNVINDSKKERIKKKKELAELSELYSSDSITASLLMSYNDAVNDPENELVHLYEIRDALSKIFKGEISARNALGLSASDWSRLGLLANNEPLKQGRHRGKGVGELRDATESELAEARNIARKFVEAYLLYLDANKK